MRVKLDGSFANQIENNDEKQGIEPVETIQEDLSDKQNTDEIVIGEVRLQVLHTPGHTPGSCSFLRESDRTLICGDCVLKRITPNPVISTDPVEPHRRFNSLNNYLASLRRLREIAPTKVYGGHGEPIYDYEEIYNRYIRAIDERQRKVIGSLSKEGTTAWEVANRVFPDAIGKDVHEFLAISESVAHLDYAESEGRIGVETEGGVEMYKV